MAAIFLVYLLSIATATLLGRLLLRWLLRWVVPILGSSVGLICDMG